MNEAELELLVVVNADDDELPVFMLLLEMLDELLKLMFIGLEGGAFAPMPTTALRDVLLVLPTSKVVLPPAAPPRLRRSLFMFDKNPLPVPEKKPPPPPPLDAAEGPDDSSGLPLPSTFGAEVLRPNIGVGRAGLIKRSLVLRFTICPHA